MSWIAVRGPETAWTCPDTFGGADGTTTQLQTRGSIVIETRIGADERPQTLLGYERRHPWTGRIAFQAVPGGGVVVILAQGEQLFHAVIPPENSARTETLRLTYSWDAPERWGRLAVERPETGSVRMIDTPAPPPLMAEDLYTIIHRPELCDCDPDVIFCAVSDQIEPVGPMPSITESMPVETPRGPVRAGALRSGDVVRTVNHGPQRILAVVRRHVPAIGSFRPVTLRAPYLGLTRDIRVAPGQRLVIGGPDVEYIFGRETVLIPADALAHGFTGTVSETRDFVTYLQFVVPQHDALIVSGAGLESLYLGRLRRDRTALSASLLCDHDPAQLPEHVRAGYQTLGPFEAATLAQTRAA
ncbi:Hint domain-containing protein [Roseivivax halotolerans]|uniref:Hint domain-containing protein n=1 Tax=Roseivivax halotolerans TaxID=93684 RepID=A0A1I5V2W6_9RHOB|nr:Hint domain-containing protein [Roseivivax halotolerans]SFQ01845.1 Hint domain-containing protein [Roseivivax halotolerans]